MKAVEAIRRDGCEVIGMIASFTYGFDVSVEAFKKAKVELVTLTNYNAVLDAVIARYTAQKPVYDFVAPDDGFGHTFWIIDRQEDIEVITKEFAKSPALYIADGHHRSAAAALVGAEKAGQIPLPSRRRGVQLLHGSLFPPPTS